MPTLDGLVAALVAGGFAASMMLLIGLLVRGVPNDPARRRPRAVERFGQALRSPALTGRIAAAILAAVVTMVVTHWPVAAVGIAALVITWPQMFGGAHLEQRQILKLEALAMWTESLRDLISANAGLERAIPQSTTEAPEAIRDELKRLKGLLKHNVPLQLALLSLSAELNDASADKVIGALIGSARRRGTGLSSVLSDLAVSARAELDQQRRITHGRASMRRGVQLVVLVVIAFAVYLVVAGGDYIKPYDTAAGQAALAVVVGLFGVAFFWMRKLAGGTPQPPFLTRPDQRIPDADLRVVAHLTGLSPAEAQQLTANRDRRREGAVT